MTNKEFQAFLSFFPDKCRVWFSRVEIDDVEAWEDEKREIYFFTMKLHFKPYDLDTGFYIDEDKLAKQEKIAIEHFDYEEWFHEKQVRGEIYLLKIKEAITHPTLPRDKIKHIIF